MKSIVLATLIAVFSLFAQARSVYPAPTIREEQNVTVNGISETWRLQWRTTPKPFCEPTQLSLTCPCQGFAYGEQGDIYLVRLRDGVEIERLHLTPLFRGRDGAVVQRWPPDYDKDYDKLTRKGFADFITSSRSTIKVMHFADYDHDGNATEFYLQTAAGPAARHSAL